MGTFRYSIDIAGGPGGPFEAIEAVVDTGASYTSLPASLLRRLGVTPHARRTFVLADGRSVEREIGRAWVRVDRREEMTLVIFAGEDTPALLGAYTIEGLALGADPLNHRLLPLPHLYLL